MTTDISIQSALEYAYRQLDNISDSPRLDAEVLLAHCLNKPRSFLKAWPEATLASAVHARFQQLIAQRRQHQPVAYLTGTKEFWSREFKVTADTLIPRPDTELLIEHSLQLLAGKPTPILLDLGTGSGILAITLGLERPDAQLVATDVQAAALQLAQQNAAQHQAGNIRFVLSDWFQQLDDQTFDLIVSNPPYIADDDPHLKRGDVQYEPRTALVAAQDGLADIRKIVAQALRHLKPEGWLLIEHGCHQQTAAQAIFRHYRYQNIQTQHDLAGQPRITYGQWTP